MSGNRTPEPGTTSFNNPLAKAPTVLVTAIREAEGARAAAAALACAGAGAGSDRAALFVDVGGRVPRPTLLASAASQELEKRIRAHRPSLRAAARGEVCHLAVAAEAEGLELAAAAATVARGAVTVLCLPPRLLQAALAAPGLRPSGVLLRADLCRDRALVGLLIRDLLRNDLDVAVLKARLGWVNERRALFGILPAEAASGLPPRLVRRLLSSTGRGGAVPGRAAAAGSAADTATSVAAAVPVVERS